MFGSIAKSLKGILADQYGMRSSKKLDIDVSFAVYQLIKRLLKLTISYLEIMVGKMIFLISKLFVTHAMR